MPRREHGAIVTEQNIMEAREALGKRAEDISLTFLAALQSDPRRYGFLFRDLQLHEAENLLPPGSRDYLVRLGQTMHDDGNDPSGDSTIPSAYTYFGQFVDHDITFDCVSAPLPRLTASDLKPMRLEDILGVLHNGRTAMLDLDSVYCLPAPRDGDKMRVGKVTPTNGHQKPMLRPPDKDDYNDLFRECRSGEYEHDRAALTGDPRNDENTIVQQLHVAFLKVHNRLIDEGKSFKEAASIVRQHYQQLVISDFLMQIADPKIVDSVLQGNTFYDHTAEPFFLPLEFTVAAYRFGHSMVRASYDYNLNFTNRNAGLGVLPAATLKQLFTFSALSGELGDFDTLPENWIIEWENFIDNGGPFNRARLIDTKLVDPLRSLPDLRGRVEEGDGARLAVRNLLRGYLLRMPTGQAVAGALGRSPLSPHEILSVAASKEQRTVLKEAGFLDRTPLWYYILAEAAAAAGGKHLGPIGSTIVAEVLIGLVRHSQDSILRTEGWKPSLQGEGSEEFTLRDLLKFAKVLS